METQHDDLQAVTAIGAFEEAWLQQVGGHSRRKVDPPVRQAVTVRRKNVTVRASLPGRAIHSSTRECVNRVSVM